MGNPFGVGLVQRRWVWAVDGSNEHSPFSPHEIFLPPKKVKYTEISLYPVGCSVNGSFSQRENETELNLIKFHLLQKSKCPYSLYF